MAEQYRNFMGYLWYQKEDNIYTIGINEEGLEEVDEVNSVDLPAEGEEVEADAVCGSLETDDGPMDIYSPVTGAVVEINSAVIEDPMTIHEDPYEGWLIKIEAEDDADEDDEDDEDEKEEEPEESEE